MHFAMIFLLVLFGIVAAAPPVVGVKLRVAFYHCDASVAFLEKFHKNLIVHVTSNLPCTQVEVNFVASSEADVDALERSLVDGAVLDVTDVNYFWMVRSVRELGAAVQNSSSPVVSLITSSTVLTAATVKSELVRILMLNAADVSSVTKNNTSPPSRVQYWVRFRTSTLATTALQKFQQSPQLFTSLSVVSFVAAAADADVPTLHSTAASLSAIIITLAALGGLAVLVGGISAMRVFCAKKVQGGDGSELTEYTVSMQRHNTLNAL